jgi:hypothetical protein
MKIRVILLLSVQLASPAFGAIKEPEVCKSVRSEKSPSLHLIDSKDTLAYGPLLIGKIAESSGTVADQVLYPTQYRIIATPMRLSLIDMCTQGTCLKLTPTKSACQNSKTYTVKLAMSFLKPGGIRPYQLTDDVDIGGFRFEDPQSDHETEVKYNFKSRILGQLVEQKQ